MNNIVLKDNENKEINIKENEESSITLINENCIDNKYIFNLDDNSNLYINILDASSDIKRNITINLNGKNSNVFLNLSAISLGEITYEINVFHNNKNTHSQTNLHGLSIDNNKITFINNGSIKKGSFKSILNQDNKIIITNENNSKIEPNLYIDEYDVSASHGAYIGKFKEEDIFYLMSRGLSKKEANYLMIKGFLLGSFEDKKDLIKIIDKYWR